MILPRDDHDAGFGNVRCFGCGGRADSEWHGDHANLAVCYFCAVALLPRVLADVVAARARFLKRGDAWTSDPHLDQLWTRVRARFWEDFAGHLSEELRLSRSVDETKTEECR